MWYYFLDRITTSDFDKSVLNFKAGFNFKQVEENILLEVVLSKYWSCG
jgi:hypothetical protein